MVLAVLWWSEGSSARSVHNPQLLETFQVCAAVTEGFRWLPRGTAEIIPQGAPIQTHWGLYSCVVKIYSDAPWLFGEPGEQLSLATGCGQVVTHAEWASTALIHPAKNVEGLKEKVDLIFEPQGCRCTSVVVARGVLVSPDTSRVFPWACRAGFNFGFPACLAGFILCMPCSGMDLT